MKTSLTEDKRLQLVKLKKEIAKMVSEDLSLGRKKADNFYLLEDFINRSLEVIEFSSLISKHMAIEYDLKAPTTFFSVSHDYFSKFSKQEFLTTHHYNPARNTVGVNMSRSRTKPLGCLMGDFICHELRHKFQIDRRGFVENSLYLIYKMADRVDMDALWSVDKAELDAEKFGYFYTYKLLGGSHVMNRRIIRAFKDNFNYAKESFRFIYKGKKRYKKIKAELPFYPKALKNSEVLQQVELFEYFKNNGNVISVEYLGLHFQLPIRTIKQIVVSSNTEEDMAVGFVNALSDMKPINLRSIPKSDIMLPNSGYLLPLYTFMANLFEYKNYVENEEDLKKDENLSCVVRAAFYASLDEQRRNKTEKQEENEENEGSGEEKLLRAIKSKKPKTLTFSKQDLLDIKEYLKESQVENYMVFNKYSQVKLLLDLVRFRRVMRMEEAVVAVIQNSMEC